MELFIGFWFLIVLSALSCVYAKSIIDNAYNDQTRIRVVVQKNLILNNMDLGLLVCTCAFSFGISLIFSIIYYHIINKKFKKTGL